MNKQSLRIASVLGLLALAGSPVIGGGLAAQGAGSAAQQVLQMPTGARSAALAGAYTAVSGDVDILFYNPGGLAGLFQAAGVAYQRHVEDINLGALAGATRLGPVTVGAGIAFLDAGEFPVIVPDPNFGGQRGIETGETVTARETALRIGAGMPLLDGRLHAGAALGYASSDLAGVGRSAPFIDLGLQAAAPFGITLGAALRNLGGSMGGTGAEDAPLPAEARLGASYRWIAGEREIGALLAADGIYRFEEEEAGFAAGIEIGLMPVDLDQVGAVFRAGFTDAGEGGLGSFHLGAGASISGIAVDYSFQNLEFFGAAHRIGVRWMRGLR